MNRCPDLLYKNTNTLKVGEFHRYIITYTPDIHNEIGNNLYLKIKNIENVLMTPALLTGPYIIYCDIKSIDYSHKDPCFITADQPVFEPNLIPGQSLIHCLSLHKLKDKYIWVVDIVSQIVFSTTSEINFEIVLTGSSESLHSKVYGSINDGNYNTLKLNIQHLNTLDLWHKSPNFQPSVKNPIHLVILTHGLHSNSTADMFYLKEQIEKIASKTGENILIKSFTKNVCQTERGVKYLGRRLAEYIINEATKNVSFINKISFIGHSLGGLVQTFAISYINFNYPNFFQKIKPENFITMASPLLGISNENPTYVKIALKFGIVGKTGQDLNLQGNRPLLLLLPSEPTRKILKQFKRRTVYANVLHDGIVPLRTSALLYLDWKGLSKVYEAVKKGELKKSNMYNDNENGTKNDIKNNDQASEIPDEVNQTTEDDNFIDSIKSKFQTAIGFCLPNLQTNTEKYQFFQTNDDEIVDNNDKKIIANENLVSIPKSSIISSIKRILLPPLPDSKYLNDPKSRENVILHDKIYTPSMIPKKHTTLKNIEFDLSKRHRYLEEKIARRWHSGMAWRKVLVNLKPDAHNNMIVRRRFANAYGWGVVDHMVENHFNEDCMNGLDSKDWECNNNEETNCENVNDNGDEFDDIDLDKLETKKINNEFTKVLNKEFIKMHHEDEIKKEESDMDYNHDKDSEDENEDDRDDSWINETTSGYYDGPTGMINSVSVSVNNGVDAWKKSVFDTVGSGNDLTARNNIEDNIREDLGLNQYI